MFKIQACRIIVSKTLIPILDLGGQALTGVFPKRHDEPVTTGPLRFVWCPQSGLVQLNRSYDFN